MSTMQSSDPVVLTYSRLFYEAQLERQRPAGLLLEASDLQVRVEISRADLELLRHDARLRSTVDGEPNTQARIAARATFVRIRMALAEAGRRPGRYD